MEEPRTYHIYLNDKSYHKYYYTFEAHDKCQAYERYLKKQEEKVKTKCEKCGINDSSHFFLKKEICGCCYDKIMNAINSLR